MKGFKTMKNSKIAKLLVLALSLMLLVGSAVGIAVSAEGDSTYDIAKISVAHGDRTYVLMAVDAPVEDAASIEVKYSYGGSDYVAEYDGTSTVVIDEVTYPVFYTHGISPKDIGEDIIAEAHAKGAADYTAKSVNVSVAEYLYNMLYAQNYVNATEPADINLKTLYEAHIAYGAAAQQALWNDVEDTDRTLITERSYVYSAYATINESGARELLLPAKNGEVTLTKNAEYPAEAIGWTVTTYNADGTTTVTDYEKTDTVSISGHSVITPYIKSGITFENATLGQQYNGSADTNIIENVIYKKALTDYSLGAYVSIENDPLAEEGAVNKVLHFYANNTGSDGGNTGADVKVVDKEDGANCYVVEFDVLLLNVDTSSNVQMQMVNSSGTPFFGFGLYAIAGETEAMPQKCGSSWVNVGSDKKAVNVWTNIRIEFYPDVDNAKIWFGDDMIAGAAAGSPANDDSNFALWRFSTASNSNVDMYVDNVICETIVKEYNASDTSR